MAHGQQVSRRLVGHWVLLSRFGSPGFLAGARRVVGQCLRSAVQRRGASGWWPRGEKGPAKFKRKLLFPSSPLHVRGEEERGTVSFKTTPFCSFFFFFFIQCMKRRRFGENAPFHLNVVPERANFQISPQSSFVHFNCTPAKISPRPYSWPRFSLWSLASDLCN